MTARVGSWMLRLLKLCLLTFAWLGLPLVFWTLAERQDVPESLIAFGVFFWLVSFVPLLVVGARRRKRRRSVERRKDEGTPTGF